MNWKLDTNTRAFITGFLPPLIAEFVKMGSGTYNDISGLEMFGIWGAAVGTGIVTGLAAAFALNTDKKEPTT